MSTNDSRRIIIFDTTLRDGEQSPGCSMNLDEKLEVAQALVDLGVDVIEAGFPIASPGDFESVPQDRTNGARLDDLRARALQRQGHRSRRRGA
jgi:2-isopropylmalate synthase